MMTDACMMDALHKDHAGTRTFAHAVCHRYKLLQYLVSALFAHWGFCNISLR